MNIVINEPPTTGFGFSILDIDADEVMTFTESDHPDRTFMTLEEAHTVAQTTIEELVADGQHISTSYMIVKVTAEPRALVTNIG